MTTEETIAALDRGEIRVAEPDGDDWRVNQEAQAAILDYFRLRQTINVKPEHHQRMNKRPVRINLPILENINLRVGEKNPIAILRRREIDP